jgi:hypothetical protein
LDSSFVSICRVWFIPSSHFVFLVKTVHRRRREEKKTQFIMCVHFFSILAPVLDHIAWGFLFLFFFSLMWHTHTHCARSDDFDKSTKKTMSTLPRSLVNTSRNFSFR